MRIPNLGVSERSYVYDLLINDTNMLSQSSPIPGVCIVAFKAEYAVEHVPVVMRSCVTWRS